MLFNIILGLIALIIIVRFSKLVVRFIIGFVKFTLWAKDKTEARRRSIALAKWSKEQTIDHARVAKTNYGQVANQVKVVLDARKNSDEQVAALDTDQV